MTHKTGRGTWNQTKIGEFKARCDNHYTIPQQIKYASHIHGCSLGQTFSSTSNSSSGSTGTIRTLLTRVTTEGTHQEYDRGIFFKILSLLLYIAELEIPSISSSSVIVCNFINANKSILSQSTFLLFVAAHV